MLGKMFNKKSDSKTGGKSQPVLKVLDDAKSPNNNT